jgi:Fur family ferric uptake transcriptional regulator
MKRRKTASKERVLSLLRAKKFAMSHESIADEIEDINRATIYRILNQFCEDGLAHKVIVENGKQFFALCRNCGTEDHHHNHLHFQCKKCNQVECFKSEVNISLPEGYRVENFNGLVSGLCNNCLAA